MSGDATNDVEIVRVLHQLFEQLRVGRVTLRPDIVDERGRRFPVTYEVLAPSAPSIRDEEYTDIFTSPVAVRAAGGEQVIQDDSASCYPDDEEFQTMLADYGDMRAQIVTPAIAQGIVVGIVSAHHLGAPRTWTAREIDACRLAADSIASRLQHQTE